MASSFGYEAHKYGVPVACADGALMPRVEDAHEDTVVLADGFRCRSQIADLTSRKAVHIAQLLQRNVGRRRTR